MNCPQQETQTHLFPPDLSDDQVLGAVCGLRPCRRGGLRLGVEHDRAKSIIHNYGHGGCGVTIGYGTAKIAVDYAKEIAAHKNESIAVLGAGVVGLTTAQELLNRGFSVTLYAEHQLEHTTSALAGALWLPVGVEFGTSVADQEQKTQIMTTSHEKFQSIDRDLYGVHELTMYEPAGGETEDELFGHLFDHGLVQLPEKISSFPFECQAEPGRKFTTDFIHTHQFLSALQCDILSRGAKIRVSKFESANDLQSLDEQILINCLGMGSRKLFSDEQVYAARGVLVHLRPQELGYGVHDGYKYMFPRRNALVLGGCFHEDDWNNQPDELMVNEILSYHRRFFGQI